MEIEDCTARTQAAIDQVVTFKEALGLPLLEVQTLAEFGDLARREALRPNQRKAIVEEAILLLEQLYAHLPFKQARYAINPVRRLRLLMNRVKKVRDPEFHEEILDIFTELRDAHTFYALPEPYKDRAAFLPFLLGSYLDGDVTRFLVTDVIAGFDHPTFAKDAEVTHWNGVPIAVAVQRMADRTPAGNSSARFVRGLARLTMRMLTFSPLPDEEMVFVQYRALDPAIAERVVAIPWNVAKGLTLQVFASRQSSVCGALAQSALLRQVLWRPHMLAEQRKIEDRCRTWDHGRNPKKPASGKKRGPVDVNLQKVSSMPQIFEFQYAGGDDQGSLNKSFLACPEAKGRKLGYLRIKRFDSPAEDAFFSDRFVGECKRILELLDREAPDGLILDVRGNPGGDIVAAERILQLFTPVTITPAAFHFVNTPLTQVIAQRLEGQFQVAALRAQLELGPWLKDLRNSITEGDLITHGHTITEPETANDTGQAYHGRVVALSDARVYSAAEIFLGGFQDHRIGKVIGINETTGGGGANRWLHQDVSDLTKQLPGLQLDPVTDPRGLKDLPKGADLALAIRRSSRVGPNSGAAIEDVGVRCDVDYQVTRGDLCYGDRDLIAYACRTLVGERSCSLEIIRAELAGGKVMVTLSCSNLSRLECYLDGYPQAALASRGSGETVHKLEIPTAGLSGKPQRLTVRGFCRRPPGEAGAGTLGLAASSTARVTRPRRKKR